MNDIKELIENTNLIKQLDIMFDQEEIDDSTYNDSKDLILSSIGDNIDSICEYRIYLKNKIEECQSQYERYYNIKKRYENKIKNLDLIILNLLQSSNTNEIKGNLSSIKTKKNSFVDVEDISKIPNEFLKTSTLVKPDKEKIKKFLSNKENTIEGCKINYNTTLTYK